MEVMIMNKQEKLSLLEEIMDMEEGTLKESTILADLDEWDSMSRLSVIVMMSDEFGKTITGEDVKKYITVKDILDQMD